MNIGKFSLKNSVLMNILMVAVIILGILSFFRLPKEEMSDISFSWFYIIIPYPGVAAEDVEKSITVKIEDELQDIGHVKRITSISQEGSAYVQVDFEDGLSKELLRKLMQDVRNEVDKVELPEGTEDPIMDEFTTADFMPVIAVTATGDSTVSNEWLNKVMRDLKKDILKIDEVSQAQIIGGREREIWVDVNRKDLLSYGLSLDEVAQAIQRRHITVPSGTVENSNTIHTTRTQGELKAIEDIDSIIIRAVPGEGDITVQRVATVNGGLGKAAQDVRLNGEVGVTLNISKTSAGNAIKVVEEVRKKVKEYQKRYEGELTFELTGDTTVRIKEVLSSLGKNSVVGIFLLVFTLFLFLGVRNSIITAMGVPVTFAITFIFLEYTGNSLNSQSTFALVLVLGMIVDHAIVIIENIYRHRQEGKELEEAVEVGTNEVVIPVIAATATTVAAFLPLMLLPGLMGAFLRIIPLVVTLALVASTFEALFFIPVHFAEFGSRVKEEGKFFKTIKKFFRGFVTALYDHKYITILVALIIIIGSLVMSTSIKPALFDAESLPMFTVNIKLPLGTSRAEVNRIANKYEEILLPDVGKGEITSVNTAIGFMETETEWITEDHVAQIKVNLEDKSGVLKRSIEEICDDYRDRCQNIAGADEVYFNVVKGGPPVDKPINIRMLGQDIPTMLALSDTIKTLIAELPAKLVEEEEARVEAFKKQPGWWKEFWLANVRFSEVSAPYNIKDNFERNSPEYVISVDEKRAGELGLTVAEIGMFFRSAIDGQRAATFFDDGEDIDILVKFADSELQSMEEFQSLLIPTRTGAMVPFEEVCTIYEQTGIQKIFHYKNERAITISADMDDKVLAQAVNNEIKRIFEEELSSTYTGVTLDLEGEFAEFNRVLTDLVGLMFVGAFLLYVILGAQFKSYVQPIIMFFTIPFAVVGVVLFMIISQAPFTISVMYSAVALIGISVNDSIVLISFINHNRRVNGMGTEEAVINGAVTRLRPIILTSVTTMGGLIPLAVGIGGYSPVWGPMASTIIFGLFFSTTGTLLIIPCIYGIIDQIMSKMGLKMRLEGE